MSVNTIPPVDDSYWDLINDVVQTEPVEAGNPEILGLLASVGIVKGRPFAPDARMRKILSDAVKVGNATARTLALDPREEEGWAFYPGSAWFTMMWEGYEFLTPPPLITPNGVEQSPSDGARKHNARIVLLRLHRRHSGDVYATHRDRLAIHLRHTRLSWRLPRRCALLPDHVASRHPREPVLVGDGL
jgi:hypothetical protein